MVKFIIKRTKENKIYDFRYAITFGEVAIHHIGGEEIGKGRREEGFNIDELKSINNRFKTCTEYVDLTDNLPEQYRKGNEAAILIIRTNKDIGKENIPVSAQFADNLYKEQSDIEYDDKYWDSRRNKTLNKRARKNIVFGEKESTHSDDYIKPTIKAFSNLPYLSKIKNNLEIILGDKAKNLNAEGNKYHHSKSGIGFHGDSERKIVICLSLGKTSTLRYQWRLPQSSEHTLEPIDINLNHGDIYIMSEKATGYDWKSRSKVRLVHAAGHETYLNK